MKQYIEALEKCLAEQGTGDGDTQSVMEVLFTCFSLENEVPLPAVSQHFEKLDSIQEKLTLDENDAVFLLTCQISEEYRREAFYTGMSVGFHLRGELCN